ncbi:hypothetical protein ACQEVM_17300 [Streptomyces sp. CA-243310]|uniref:hypothetical protein n=1 Tax=Streptomyces sp. CA-243310 TaxID=3240056 RepID=UPI003D8F770B
MASPRFRTDVPRFDTPTAPTAYVTVLRDAVLTVLDDPAVADLPSTQACPSPTRQCRASRQDVGDGLVPGDWKPRGPRAVDQARRWPRLGTKPASSLTMPIPGSAGDTR